MRTQQLRMQQERATLENARYDLSKVRIESPIDGIVTRRNIEAGETAVIGTMNNPGTVLLTVADMSVIEAEVEVDETDIPDVQLGQAAKITIDAMPGKTFTAKVTEIGNSPIQATGQGAAHAGHQLQGGAHARRRDSRSPPGLHLHGRDHDRDPRQTPLSVPIQATTVREMVLDDKGQHRPRRGRRPAAPRRRSGGVQASGAQARAGRARKSRACSSCATARRVFEPIKTGIAGDKYFEVLSGLKDGDEVVVGPFSSVRDLARRRPR